MKSLKRLKREYARAMKVGWFLANRQIRRSGKGTTILIIFIMVLTFLNLVVVSGLLVGLISGSFEAYREAYSGEVIITPASGRDYIENSQSLVSYLKNNPLVQDISPRYTRGVTVLGTLNRSPNKNERANQIAMQMVGIDPIQEEKLTNFSHYILKGKNLNPNEEGYVLLGATMIKKYSAFADINIPGLDLLKDVDVGSRIRVTFSTKDGEIIRKDMIVKGLVKSKVDQISTRMFIVDKEMKRMLPVNKEQYQEIAVKTNRDQAPQLVAQIKKFMGPSAALVQTMDESIPSFLRDMETTMNVLGNALSSIALVVASITVFIVVFINAVTQRKFIGIMKGIGISPLAIEFSYMFQAIFYGVMGSIVGLILTFGFLRPYFDAYPINFPFSDGILVATVSGSLIRVAILLFVTICAGYIPAKLITRKNTLDSILGR